MTETIDKLYTYEPTVPQAKYIMAGQPSMEYGILFFRGGWGAGKTKANCNLAVDVAVSVPTNKVAIFRKVRADIKESVWGEFLDTVNPNLVADIRTTDLEVDLYTILSDKDEKMISTVMFRGLDDMKRLGSKFYGHIFVEELDELNQSEFEHLQGRLRHKVDPEILKQVLNRSPYVYMGCSVEDCGRYAGRCGHNALLKPMVHAFIGASFNPVEEDETQWIYREAVAAKRPDLYEIQSSTYDNAKNLVPKYLQLLQRLPAIVKNRVMLGNWGAKVKGPPTTPSFKLEAHTFEAPHPTDPVPLFLLVDFGYTHPAVLFATFDKERGLMSVWDEILETRKNIPQLVNENVKPKERLWNPKCYIHCYVDHQAAIQHSDKSEKTSDEWLKSLGYATSHEYSTPKARILLIEHLLQNNQIRVHTRCKKLITALSGGWHWKDGTSRDTEMDDGIYIHIGHAFGYGAVGMFGQVMEKLKETTKTKTKVEDYSVHPQILRTLQRRHRFGSRMRRIS